MLKKQRFDIFLQFNEKLIVKEQTATGLRQAIQKTLNDAVFYRDLKYILFIELERPSGPLT